MQCDIRFQGNKKTTVADIEFQEVSNAPTRVRYNGKIGYLNADTKEVFKDTNLIVLWFTIVKSQAPLPH